MADLWYYGRGSDIVGPLSGWDVADLADRGVVLPTDTVWVDGDEDGVLASAVPHLFPAAAAPPVARTPPPRKSRATGGRGVLIEGQDGKTVRYRMKCTACGHQDAGSHSLTIARGTTRVAFYCPRCRKRRTGDVHGQVG